MATATATTRLLGRNEAAAISGVSLSAVNKAVEQRVIRPRRTKRGKTLLAPEETLALALLSLMPVALPVAFKRLLRDWVVSMSAEDVGKEFALSQALTVSFTEELAEVSRRVDKYVKLREKYVEVNPNVMAGTPVIRGTRVPVRTLAKLVEGGESREALREDYPHIPSEAYELAVLWSKGSPRRGRPAAKATARGASTAPSRRTASA